MINSVQMNTLNQYKPAYGVSSSPGAPKKSGNSKLSVFYINDMHGNIDNMAGMIAASDKFDKSTGGGDVDTLKISAGDNVSGGDEKRNQLVINLLARMGIEASAVGNHEFDSTISTFYKFLSPNSPKFLAANADVPNGSGFYNNVQKSEVIEVNGTKYGLIGLMPFDLMTVIGGDDKKLEGIRPFSIENSIKAVNEEAKKLTEQGIDRIILVSHIGNDKDREIVSKLHGVDVIIGGHSHTEVKDVKAGENLFNNADGKPVVIVQTGENAKNVGILNVEFNEAGDPIRVENNLIRTSQEKSPVLDYFKEAVMGKSPEVGYIESIDPYPDNRRITPCAWTNFMCDAMREELNVDIAFVNASNTRKVPKTGKLTERDISESTPLKNTLLTKKMTEKEVVRAIQDALKDSFKEGNRSGEPGILHTSGLNYVADTKGKLFELSFVDKNGNKTPIDINNPSDKVYTVCYDSFVAGGTEYPVFVPEKMTYPEIDKKFEFDKDKLLIDYLKKHKEKELNIKDDGRTVIMKDGAPLTAACNKTGEEKEIEEMEEVNSAVQNNSTDTILKPINSNAAINAYSQYSPYTPYPITQPVYNPYYYQQYNPYAIYQPLGTHNG